MLFIPKALAQAPCELLPEGCGEVNMFPEMLAITANVIAMTVAALCVLMTVWGGVQMGISNGDESKITKGRDSIVYGMIGLAISLLAQSIVNYVVVAATGIRDAGAENVVLAAIDWGITTLVYFFNVAIFFVIFWGGLQFVLSRGNSDKTTSARRMILWAVIGGLFINLARMGAEFVLSLGL